MSITPADLAILRIGLVRRREELDEQIAALDVLREYIDSNVIAERLASTAKATDTE